MAEATLNFVEAELNHSSDLFDLYDRLYRGMVRANAVDPPTFPSSEDFMVLDGDGLPTFDDDGNPILDQAKKAQAELLASQYADILMKNSAYLFADSILSVIGAGGQGSSASGGFVSRNGDSMVGGLQALYGFEAGINQQKIFEVILNASNKKFAIVSGNLKVTEDAFVEGSLNIGDGIVFGNNKVIYYDNGTLHIENPTIDIEGDITVDGTFTLGDVVINENGIFWGSNEFYHSGNSNKSDVDWSMQNGTVYGDLTVKGLATFENRLNVLNGFSLGYLNKALIYSSSYASLDGESNPIYIPYVSMDSDLDILNSHGIKINGEYVVNMKNGNIVAFSAPNMTLNLGDNDTEKISLQSDIWDYSNTYKLLSKEGAGYLPNGLIVQSAVNGPIVLQSYAIGTSESGILFPQKVRLGDKDNGPALYQDPKTDNLTFALSYLNSQLPVFSRVQLKFSAFFEPTTSPFRNLALIESATLHFDTDGEFFAFDKPVEASYFAIKSERYKTRLLEDALFFDDGKFIEGVTDGLRFAGNGYFDGNISSPSFASGFAGYGWAIKDQVTEGGYHATFDSLTVRKKMRVYELEVQKISCTNGSLWVSDFCSGDEVIALN